MRDIILILLFTLGSVFAFAQQNDDVVGQWYNADKDIVINLFEDGIAVSGEIIWMKFPNDENGKPKTDLLNLDEKLRSRSIIGIVIMSSFSHIEGKVWDNGSFYDYEKGKTYSGMMTLKDANTLDLRGYIGFSFFGRYSSTWTRNTVGVKFVNQNIVANTLLIKLREDLNKIIEIIESISLIPAEQIIQKIENEDLLIKLKEDLGKITQKIEAIKKAD